MASSTQVPSNQLSKQQERELKWSISAEDAVGIEDKFCRKWGPSQLLHQDNRFFDSADGKLRQQRMSLRLRRENEQVILTCKQRKSVHRALHHQQEEECSLNAVIWANMAEAPSIDPRSLPIPIGLRSLLGQEALVNMGGFYNRRRQWGIDGDTLCLDFSVFSANYSEWELEIEIPENETGDASEQHWRDTFNAMGITLLSQSRSKLQRFIEGPEGKTS